MAASSKSSAVYEDEHGVAYGRRYDAGRVGIIKIPNGVWFNKLTNSKTNNHLGYYHYMSANGLDLSQHHIISQEILGKGGMNWRRYTSIEAPGGRPVLGWLCTAYLGSNINFEHLYEVIPGNMDQKYKTDTDATPDWFPEFVQEDNPAFFESIVIYLHDQLIRTHWNVFSTLSGREIKFKDFLRDNLRLFQSHADDGSKFSWHIIIHGFHCLNNVETRTIRDMIADEFIVSKRVLRILKRHPDQNHKEMSLSERIARCFLDTAVYGPNQLFRLPGHSKLAQDKAYRCKVPDFGRVIYKRAYTLEMVKELPDDEDETNYRYFMNQGCIRTIGSSSSQITLPEDLRPKVTKSGRVFNHSLDEREYEGAFVKLTEKGFGDIYEENTGGGHKPNDIALLIDEGVECPVCKRVHDKNNHNFIQIYKGIARLHCWRQEKDVYKRFIQLGRIEAPIKNHNHYRFDDPYTLADHIREFSGKEFVPEQNGRQLILDSLLRVFRIVAPDRFFYKSVDNFATPRSGFWLAKNNFTASQERVDNKTGKTKHTSLKVLPDSMAFFGSRLMEFMSKTIKVIPYHAHDPSKTPPEADVFNQFPGMLATFDFDMSKEEILERCKPILDHIYNILASGNKDYYHYIVSWLAKLVQTLGKTDVCLVLYSRNGGSGKNILFDFLNDYVLGDNIMLNNIIDIESLVANFNAHLKGKILAVVDEQTAQSNGFTQTFNKMKGLLTRKKMTVTPKGFDSFQVVNHLSVIITTNNPDSLFTPPGGRKYALFEVNEDRVGDLDYFGDLADKINNQRTGDAFYKFLMQYEPCDIRKIPRTEFLKLSEELSTSHSDLFFKGLFGECDTEVLIPSSIVHVKNNKLFIINQDLYDDVYKPFAETENRPMTSKKFSIYLMSNTKTEKAAAVRIKTRAGKPDRRRGVFIQDPNTIKIVIEEEDYNAYNKYLAMMAKRKETTTVYTWEKLQEEGYVVPGGMFLEVFSNTPGPSSAASSSSR